MDEGEHPRPAHLFPYIKRFTILALVALNGVKIRDNVGLSMSLRPLLHNIVDPF